MSSVFLRDDDDINDVASMAGVNLNEENARILATSSELVGTKIRSCKDESFLPAGALHRRVMDTGTRSHTHTHRLSDHIELELLLYIFIS